MRGVVLLVCLCACKQIFGLDDPASGDGGIHDDGPRADAQLCWSVPQVSLDFCLDRPLSGDVTVATTQPLSTDDNDAGLKCMPTSNPGLCVIAGDTITITATGALQARGGRPLVLVGRTIVVQGTLDVASHFGMPHGAGGDAGPCAPGIAATGRGGGAGGSFGTKGGNGGDQDAVTNTRGIAGLPSGSAAQFRGGCPGGDGGGSLGHGSGGGAVALLAGSITLSPSAVINASGAGGAAGDNDDGGNGAGSGGMVVLQTPSLTATVGVSIFANGGGGGGAGDTASSGENGGDPTSPSVGGRGGQGAGSDSGDGGDGYPASAALINGVNGGAMQAGGGGGAGGAGVIRVFGATLPASVSVSPPPS